MCNQFASSIVPLILNIYHLNLTKDTQSRFELVRKSWGERDRGFESTFTIYLTGYSEREIKKIFPIKSTSSHQSFIKTSSLTTPD